MNWFKELKSWKRWGIIFGIVYLSIFILVSIMLKVLNLTGESRLIILPLIAPSLLFGEIFLRTFMYSERNVLLYLYHLLFNTFVYSGLGALLGFILKSKSQTKHSSFHIVLFILLPVGFEITLIVNSTSWAYNVPTHQAITQRAIQLSSIEATLQSQLSFSLATTSFYDVNLGLSHPGNTWIMKGSMFEDQPPEDLIPSLSPRPKNHFHNPITNQGLTDGIDFFAESARTWGISDSDNKWSWNHARQYFFDALTQDTQEERDDNFAKMFRSLGQVVHLIQDMAVPAHVRNDNHAIMSTLSGFSSRFDFFESIVEQRVNPLTFGATPFSFSPNFSLSSFWDGEIYRDLPTLQSGLTGLSEYTSYNFFSEDTIFTENREKTDPHYFPHPRKEFTDAALKEDLAEDGSTDRVYYVQGYETVRLAAYSYFHRPLADAGLLGYVPSGWTYHLDESVVMNNAYILIPKAISYSAGLLNYFFRGDIDMVEDPNTPRQYFIENKTDEPMSGTFSLYYDDTEDQRRYLIASWDRSIGPKSQSEPVSFSLPISARPQDQSAYTLVFRGALGAEADAVVVKVLDNLKSEYGFILQETLTLNSSPIETPLTPDSYYILREGSETIWPTDQQIRTGRFVTYGTIKSIKRVGTSGGKLYLDDNLISSNVWNQGDTPTPPSQWRVEGPGTLALEVELDNEMVISQGLFSYGRSFSEASHSVSSSRYKHFGSAPCLAWLYNCVPNGEREILTIDDVRSVTRADLYLNSGSNQFTTLRISTVSESVSVPMNNQFDLPVLSGANPVINSQYGEVYYQLDGPYPPTAIPYVYVKHYIGSLWSKCGVGWKSWPGAYLIIEEGENWYHLFDGSFWDPQTGLYNIEIGPVVGFYEECPDPYDYYDSLTVPDEIPLMLPGQIDRVYSQAELDYLEKLGIEPEHYSIILK